MNGTTLAFLNWYHLPALHSVLLPVLRLTYTHAKHIQPVRMHTTQEKHAQNTHTHENIHANTHTLALSFLQQPPAQDITTEHFEMSLCVTSLSTGQESKYWNVVLWEFGVIDLILPVARLPKMTRRKTYVFWDISIQKLITRGENLWFCEVKRCVCLEKSRRRIREHNGA